MAGGATVGGAKGTNPPPPAWEGEGGGWLSACLTQGVVWRTGSRRKQLDLLVLGKEMGGVLMGQLLLT